MSFLVRRTRACLLVLALALLAGACGQTAQLPPDQIMNKTIPAMQAANSFHFTLDTSKIQKPMPGLFLTKAEGDVVKPDKLAGSVSALYSGVPINVKVVVDGTSQYMTDPASARWGAMPAYFDVAQFFNPSKGISDILSNVKGLANDGTENVGGVDTYRLKATVPTSALKSLSSEITAQGDVTATLWVGSGDFLLRQVRLQGPLINGEPSDIMRTITIKDYNKPVNIETPVVK